MFIVPASARSWIEVEPASPFPIQNLPFGLLARPGLPVTLAVAIGAFALDLTALRDAGHLVRAHYPVLDAFEEFDPLSLGELRREVFRLLEAGSPSLAGDLEARARALVPLAGARMLLPIRPPGFVDFYSGIHHASNVGRLFRPDGEPLLPNYRHLPVAYNGRASSVVVSGTPVVRPWGQLKGPGEAPPEYAPTRELDFELEMGFYAGLPSPMGEVVPIGEAPDLVLGYVLVNDWSARDVQRWEYQPLGPFLSKAFATSVSPWVVLPDALEPFRLSGTEQEPEPLPYLRPEEALRYDVKLEVALKSDRMRRGQTVARSNAKYLYWSFDQQIAHLTSGGGPVAWGDLVASGTISGPLDGSYGSMLELTARGARPLLLEETGEERTFLADGDELALTGWAQGEGYRVGFGEVSGRVEPALAPRGGRLRA